MKNLLFCSYIICFSLIITGCEDFLKEESETKITSEFLYNEPEGLKRAVTSLYNYSRRMLNTSESTNWVIIDRGTDIDVFRGGGGATFFRFDNLTPANENVQAYWEGFYFIIGRANEIIHAGENNMDQDNDIVKQTVAEAKVFRAQSYFYLIRKFDKVYFNITPTTPDNYDEERVYGPDSVQVFTQMYQDLDGAIENLEKTTAQPGRFTQGAARHIKAKVAMWKNDWDEAIRQVDSIKASGQYELLANPSDVFGAGDLNHREAIYTLQFSRDVGGGDGHRMSLIYTPVYNKVAGLDFSYENGGYGWGRAYPNKYLLNKFDQANDRRWTAYFKHEWYYRDENTLPAGKQLGDVAVCTDAQYMEQMHQSCSKFTDFGYTIESPEERLSYKDVMVYRLAETYLMGAEAYFHKNGGNDPNAIWYFSEIRKRAGLGEFTGTLTLDLILDEHAKELLFEGDRWFMLKRLGLLYERARLYGGETKAENRTGDFTQPRQNMKPFHVRWPIPQSAIDQMGSENFPQNTGY
ncbi:MAG: RagB/SusD family nutrient uptake outer membrane protein [Bacteroidales bacterium]|jgi:hypothetical protein|nr:RagB/SusD family nutrient uptake outer membrane protein [Bacteroidales bacterium]